MRGPTRTARTDRSPSGPSPAPLPAYPVQLPVPDRLRDVHAAIITCEACPRLRTYCRGIAETRRAAYRHETYWARPVPGFGDAKARLLIVGLAPAAHGANRTGRVFTGDGVNASGDFLMRAMMAGGFVNQATCQRPDDGLVLTDAYIAAAVRCAPPDNKPTPEEVLRCLPHLEAEIDALPRVELIVTLGRIAYDAYRRLLARDRRTKSGGYTPTESGDSAATEAGSTRAKSGGHRSGGIRLPSTFAHGQFIDPPAPGLPAVLQSYHPSRQNTHTGRLTDEMMAAIFIAARQRLAPAATP